MLSGITGKIITTYRLMISRNKMQYVISLQRKKVRDSERLYIIEGDKIVKEYLMSGKRVVSLIGKSGFIGSLPADLLKSTDEIIPVSYDELRKISTLSTPHNALALIPMPEDELDQDALSTSLGVALDFIQDPGNLGTIIRAAAWFGIRNVICSKNCVDVYNPKVIQASMGAMLNVRVYYLDLEDVLENACARGVTIYAAVLDGPSLYTSEPGNSGIILLGNESRGISDELMKYVTVKLAIPKFTVAEYGIDSLNAGMAASIIFSEFARHNYSK